eukprot:7003563-Prymnesium_polylepis.2
MSREEFANKSAEHHKQTTIVVAKGSADRSGTACLELFDRRCHDRTAHCVRPSRAAAAGPGVSPVFGASAASFQAAEDAASTAAEREEVHAAAEAGVREASAKGMFKHMLATQDREKLHALWTEAFAHAGVPPHVLEDPAFRHAVTVTSMAKAPYVRRGLE